VIAAAALVLAWWGLSYYTSEFKGGLDIRDDGLISYPRYHARLGYVSLSQPGEYQFTVGGLPPESLDLTFPIENASGANRSQLEVLSTTLDVTVMDSSGKQLCSAIGALGDAAKGGRDSWVLASSDEWASFWHPNCLRLPIKRSQMYSVRVRVMTADPASLFQKLVPTLEGGGNELP